MNAIRRLPEYVNPINHLRLRDEGVYLEADMESDGTGALTVRWGDRWGVRLFEVAFDTGLFACFYYSGYAPNTWNIGEDDEHRT